jgi:solute carrier family 35 protein E3
MQTLSHCKLLLNMPLVMGVLLQIAKLLIIPFVCVVELVWMKRQFTPRVVCSILTVVAGVAIV